jgi:PadR family transcriptional regulator PadR
VSGKLPLLKGTLDMLILKALSIEPTHGYGLSVWLEQGSRGEIVVEDSAIYQALRRLEGRRLVEAEWGVTENSRRARYYRLTAAGRRHLEEEARTWGRYAHWVGELLAIDGRAASG